MSRNLSIVLALLAASCTSTVHPPGATRDGEHAIVASLQVKGGKSIDKEALIKGLALRPPIGRLSIERTYFDALSHRLDVQRIEEFYRRNGFLSAKVTRSEARNLSTRRVALDYEIDEGPRTVIRDVRISIPEDTKADRPLLEKATLLRANSPLVYETYEADKDELLRRLIAQGYPFARISGAIEVLPGKELADIRYDVDLGPASVFGSLTIVGNRRIPDSAIRPRVTFRESQAFSWKALEETRTALYQLGVFASVEFEFDRSQRLEVTPVTLRVREAPSKQLKLGVGLGVDKVNYELRFLASHRRSSFLLPTGLLQLEVTPKLSYLRGFDDDLVPGFEASSRYTVKDVGLTNLDLTGKFSYAVENYNSYSIQGPKVSFGIIRSFLENRLQLSLSWRFRYQYLFRVDDVLSASDRVSVGLVEPYRLATLVQRVSYDGRDNVLDPTRGWFASFELEEAESWLGSEFRYVRASPDLRGYYPLSDAIVLAARIRLASSVLLGDVLPITQRYFSGGASSQRGFAQQTLSPVLGAPGGVPVGGEALAETSFEIRHTFTGSNWAVVGFLDGADVTMTPGELFSRPLHWAAGPGFRWHTPFGIFRVDLGFRLNRRGADEPGAGSPWNGFHLSLGEAF